MAASQNAEDDCSHTKVPDGDGGEICPHCDDFSERWPDFELSGE